MSRTVRHIVRGMRSRDAVAHAREGAAMGADLRLMRELNRLLVLNSVREQGPIARVAIARQTGLSRTTVSSIIDVLLQDGLVREEGTQSATRSGGRRAISVHFNAAAGYVLGVDMGRSHLTMLLTDLAASIVARRSGPFAVELGPAVGLPWLVRELRAFLDEQGVSWSQVIGVGVGMPGPMDARLQRPIAPPRMPGWDGVDVRGALSRELSVPIYLDNDANMGALGESRYGAGAGVADLVYLKIGTGIGGGLVMGGQVYRGSAGSAGEIGHVSADEDGPLCECGNRGCLEALASAHVIVEDARHATSLRRNDPQPREDEPSPLAAQAALDVADVVLAALEGDRACRAAVERAGEHIGVVLAGLVNVINPSLILVDGGVARAGDLLLDPIRRAVAGRSFSVASARTQIRTGALGDNAIALGGTALVIDAAFSLSARLDALPPARKESARVAREQRASRPASEEFGDAPEGFSVASARARASGGKEIPD
jgi:glucokinase-like ROK family protein